MVQLKVSSKVKGVEPRPILPSSKMAGRVGGQQQQYYYIKFIRFEKKQQIGRTRGAPKKSVPEEAEIGRSSTPFCFNLP